MAINGNGYKTKTLVIKKFGWKRIAKNVQRFGWILDDATEHTEITETTTYEGRISGDTIYINPRTNRKSKTRVWLSFYRSIRIGVGVSVLEFIYNLLFLIRRILAFCLPISLIGIIALMFLGGADLCLQIMPWIVGGFFAWIGCIIFEGVLSRIAGSILNKGSRVKKNKKQTAVQKSKTPKQKFSDNRLNDVPDDDDDLVTLKGQNGEDIDFVEIAGIAYRGNFYAILQPVELLDGMEDNEALVFKVTRGSDGEDKFEVELDDATIDAVFAEYNRLLDEAESKGY